MDPITFTASLAPITTAIKFDGRAEGGRLTLDIPDSDISELAKMLFLREECFTVTIAPLVSESRDIETVSEPWIE